MKLDTEFYKLPIRFDAERLAEEVRQFNESDWRPHPQEYVGNTTILLVSVGGDITSHAVKGPMLPTPLLKRCPYILQVMSTFKTVVGRSRLMRIDGKASANPHVDTNYYWMNRIRIHVPIITFPQVQFICNEKSVHMAAGESWIFDSTKLHDVINEADKPRIHLVIDTVGSPAFEDLLGLAEQPFGNQKRSLVESNLVPYEPDRVPEIEWEKRNFPIVMAPEEQARHIEFLFEEVRNSPQIPAPLAEKFEAHLRSFAQKWGGLWSQHQEGPEGWPHFRKTLNELEAGLLPFESKLPLRHMLQGVELARQILIRPALNPDLAPASGGKPAVPAAPREAPLPMPPAARARIQLEKPVIIVSAPRSGSTLLFETLANSPSAWTIGGESHGIFEGIPKLNPANRNWDSNRLTEQDVDPQTTQKLRMGFLTRLIDRNRQTIPAGTRAVRLLEKTPKNALRIPLLNAVFPDAVFVYLYREPHEAMSSIIEAWRSGKFVTYPKLPDWKGPAWSLLLIPGWRNLIGKPIGEIAGNQWAKANEMILNDLEALPADRSCAVTYSELLANPPQSVAQLCAFTGLTWDRPIKGPLPQSKHTLTPPEPDKWKKNEEEIEPHLARLQPLVNRAREFLQKRSPAGRTASVVSIPEAPIEVPASAAVEEAPETPAQAPAGRPMAPGGIPIQSVNTSNFPKILEKLGISLLISTYQAGKVIVTRADGEKLSLSLCDFQRPMGMSANRQRLAVGTRLGIWFLRNQPAVGKQIEPQGKRDACFVPAHYLHTGAVEGHEMAFGTDGLWLVNTRFSCLCTMDFRHSFVPRWRPPFITALAPEDRCHLNGVTMINGRPKYVSMLGETDIAQGWRANKSKGGVIMDIDSNQVVTRGLAMPHSPRWFNNQLWILESGEGTLSRVDVSTGQRQPIAHLSGYTRGLAFFGRLAFIGMSQIRETATFGELPITQRIQERTCGVWVVDTQNGQTVAFLRFESGVQEIFAVEVLPGIRFPEIVTHDEKVLANAFVIPRPQGQVPQAQSASPGA